MNVPILLMRVPVTRSRTPGGRRARIRGGRSSMRSRPLYSRPRPEGKARGSADIESGPNMRTSRLAGVALLFLAGGAPARPAAAQALPPERALAREVYK